MTNKKIFSIATAVFLISAIFSAYYTGLKNTGSTMSLDINNPYMSVSSSLHFGSRKVVLPLLFLSFVCYYILNVIISKTNPFVGYSNPILYTIAILLLSSMMFSYYNCDCQWTKYEPCCSKTKDTDGDMIIAGSCKYQTAVSTASEMPPPEKTETKSLHEINNKFENKKLDQPLCCNPPWCTKEVNDGFKNTHILQATIIEIMCILIMIISYIGLSGNWSTFRSRIYIAITLLYTLFLAFVIYDTPGDNYKLLFGITEASLIPIFASTIVVSNW